MTGKARRQSSKRGRAAPTVVAALAFGVTLTGQQQAPTFRTDVNAVVVDVRVVDGQG